MADTYDSHDGDILSQKSSPPQTFGHHPNDLDTSYTHSYTQDESLYDSQAHVNGDDTTGSASDSQIYMDGTGSSVASLSTNCTSGAASESIFKEDVWEVITSYFEEKGLVRQQLDSFD